MDKFNGEISKYLGDVRRKLGEIQVLIFDWERAMESEPEAPVAQMLDLMKDRCEYLLNDIRVMRELDEARTAQFEAANGAQFERDRENRGDHAELPAHRSLDDGE